MKLSNKETGAYGMAPMVNLFILGAQKCGTSSLHNYIGNHKDIFAPSLKEPGLLREFDCMKKYYYRRFNINFNSIEEYQQKILNGYNNEKYLCDSSTYYTIGDIAKRENIPQNIKKMSPNAVFIYIMRNPFDRVCSNYAHSIKMGDVNIGIDDYLKIDRYKSTILTSQYYSQLKAYLEYFPRESFLLLSFDQLKSEPTVIVKKIYEFLGISCDSSNFPQQFRIFNKTASLGDKYKGGIYSEENYTFLYTNFKNECENLQSLGFYADWDFSKEKWLNKSTPFSLYPSIGYVGLKRHKDIKAFKKFIEESTVNNNKVNASYALLELLVDKDDSETKLVFGDVIDCVDNKAEFLNQLDKLVIKKSSVRIKKMFDKLRKEYNQSIFSAIFSAACAKFGFK